MYVSVVFIHKKHKFSWKLILFFFFQDEIEDMEVDPLAFDSPHELSTPRIVSVQSVASFITNNNNTESDSDFENMGYRYNKKFINVVTFSIDN